ncbi:DNA primase [bacterium AH-315-E10]|nr:DNA primase [bacterium AH-315-E10]
MFSDEFKESVKDNCDIVDIINRYSPLTKAGNSFKACCPFHKEKTPSFNVNPDKQMFYCFGCQKGGDVIKFIMDHESLEFTEALRLLAQLSGTPIPEEEETAYKKNSDRNSGIRKEDLFALHDELCSWYQTQLKEPIGKEALRYIQNRGVSDTLATEFRLGFAPDAWDAVKTWGNKKGYTDELLLKAGILTQKDNQAEQSKVYDRWRGRLMFPITNDQGRIVGFSGRVITEDFKGGKYVNSPETPIFHKSRLLYGLSQARQAVRDHDYVILCEGQLDVIAFHSAGLKNTAAPQGTAFTDGQARLIKRFTQNVMLAFDSDSAGISAALKAHELLAANDLTVKVIVFQEGEDPDSLFHKQGADALKEKVRSAHDFFEFFLDIEMLKHDPTTPQGKTRITDAYVKVVARLKSAISRSEYTQLLSSRLQVPEPAVMTELNKQMNQNARQSRFRHDRQEELQADVVIPEGMSTDNSPQNIAEKRVSRIEKTLLGLCLKDEVYAQRLLEELELDDISKRPIGIVLNDILAMTAQGEWMYIEEFLKNGMNSFNCTELNHILFEPEFEDAEERDLEKAFNHCLANLFDAKIKAVQSNPSIENSDRQLVIQQLHKKQKKFRT